jgi:hypothetical protein
MAKTKTRKFKLDVLERNNIRITVDCKEQWFLLRSDAHQDNPHSRTDLEMKHLKEAEERNAIVLDFGDLFCAMEGKGDRRGAKNLKPEHTKGCYLDALVNTAADKYEPYAHIWALMGQGNHEYSILQHQETDLLERLTAMLQDRTGHKVQAGGFANWVQIRMGRRVTYKIYAHHGYGGGGPVTQDTIQGQRMAAYVEGADCTVSGHVHSAWAMEKQKVMLSPTSKKQMTKELLQLKIPTYKDEFMTEGRGFHHMKGREPKPLGAWWLKLKVARNARENGSDMIVAIYERAK